MTSTKAGTQPAHEWLHPGQIPQSCGCVENNLHAAIALHSNLLISVQACSEHTIAAEEVNNVWIEKVIWWDLGQLFRSVYIQHWVRGSLLQAPQILNVAHPAIISPGWGTPSLWLVLQTRGSKVLLIFASAKHTCYPFLSSNKVKLLIKCSVSQVFEMPTHTVTPYSSVKCTGGCAMTQKHLRQLVTILSK